jgi:hypothetical protein
LACPALDRAWTLDLVVTNATGLLIYTSGQREAAIGNTGLTGTGKGLNTGAETDDATRESNTVQNAA